MDSIYFSKVHYVQRSLLLLLGSVALISVTDPALGLRAQPGAQATRDPGGQEPPLQRGNPPVVTALPPLASAGVCVVVAVPAGPVMERAALIGTPVPGWESCSEPRVHPPPTCHPGLSLWEHPGPPMSQGSKGNMPTMLREITPRPLPPHCWRGAPELLGVRVLWWDRHAPCSALLVTPTLEGRLGPKAPCAVRPLPAEIAKDHSSQG